MEDKYFIEDNKDNSGYQNQRLESRKSQNKSRSASNELNHLNQKIEICNTYSGKILENISGFEKIDYKKVVDILQKSPEQRSMDQITFLINELDVLEFFKEIYQDDYLKQKYKLLKEMRVEKYNMNGKIIFEEGDQQKKFYVILQGGVKLVKNSYSLRRTSQSNVKYEEEIDTIVCGDKKKNNSISTNEQEVIIKVFHTGQYFGENELIYNSKRFCTAITHSPINRNELTQKNQETTIIGVFCQNTFNNYIQEFVRKLNPFYQSLSLLQLVPKEGKIKLSYFYQQKQLSLNEIIYKQDQMIDYIYYLEKGSVQLKMSSKEVLEGLPHSIQQKKEEIQLLCTIPEKSFIGDEDLLNLNRTRQYSAVVSSLSAVLFFVDASMVQNEIQEAYGPIKASQMISNYLHYKQKWRNQFLESAQKVKRKFKGFSSSPSKINQNLMLKKKIQSKQDLLKFTSNFLTDFDCANNNPQEQQVHERCKTEANNYQTIDSSIYLNTSASEMQEDTYFQMNQNHLKQKKIKIQNNAINSNSQQIQVSPKNTQLIQYLPQHQPPIQNSVGKIQQLPHKSNIDRKLKNNGGKFNTIECDNTAFTEISAPSYFNIQNQGNSRVARSESITIDQVNGESILISPSYISNNLSRPYLQAQDSQTLSPTNLNQSKGQFKIKLQRMEENEKIFLGEQNYQGGHTSIVLNGKLTNSTLNLNPGNQKIYDPFNQCWVKKSYPKKNINKIKYQIDAVRAFKQASKQRGGIQSPQGQLSLQAVSEPQELTSSNNLFCGTPYQFNIDNAGNSNMNILQQQDLKFSSQSSKIDGNPQIVKFKQGWEGKNNQQYPQLQKVNSNILSSSIIYTPIIKNHDSPQQNFLENMNRSQKENFVTVNNFKVNNAEKKQKTQYQYNRALKVESRSSDPSQNIVKQSQTTQQGNNLSDRNYSYNNKQKGQKSQTFHNYTFLNNQNESNSSKVRNNTSDNCRSSKKIDNSIIHLNQESKEISISQERSINEFCLRQKLLRGLRKQSIEQCRNDEELINSYLNKFISENCNGNEIYEIESTNLIEKKKELLKYLLNQIGSPSLNCIDINEDQKNTKYDHILRGLMKQRQENQRKRDYEQGVYSSISKQGKYTSLSGGGGGRKSRSFVKSNSNFSTTSKSPPPQPQNIDNKEYDKSTIKDQQSKIFQNIVSSYIKSRDRDPFKFDNFKSNTDDALNELSLNRVTQSITPPPSSFQMNNSLLGQSSTVKSYNMFKQKQEIKKKLRHLPLYRSINGNPIGKEKFDQNKLHQTLFIISKDQSAQ